MGKSKFSAALIAELIGRIDETEYQLISGKRIMFNAVLKDGKRKILCTPESKFHEQINGYWFDLTEVQKKLMDSYDEGLLVIRLGENKITKLSWRTIAEKLNENNVHNNSREGNHWKFNIHHSDLIIRGSKGDDTVIKIQVVCTGL